MRSSKSKSEFFAKMKKKPAQQKVLDNISDYTLEDIDQLRGPHFPKWVRQALVGIKQQAIEFDNRGGKTPEQVATEIATKMLLASLDNKE